MHCGIPFPCTVGFRLTKQQDKWIWQIQQISVTNIDTIYSVPSAVQIRIYTIYNIHIVYLYICIFVVTFFPDPASLFYVEQPNFVRHFLTGYKHIIVTVNIKDEKISLSKVYFRQYYITRLARAVSGLRIRIRIRNNTAICHINLKIV